MAKKGGASRRRFRVLPTVLLTAAILCLPTVVYAWGRTSSSFEITRVRVSGTELVKRKTVMRLLRSDYLGENLFTVTSDDVEATLSRQCYVEEARVDRDFPDTLRVRVVEHRPMLYVRGSNGWFIVADDAFVICPAGEAADTSYGGLTADKGSTPSSQDGQPSSGASPSADDASDADAADDSATTATRSASLSQGPPHAKLPLPALALDARLQARQTLSQPGVGAALRVTALLPLRLRQDLEVIEVTAQGQVTLRFDGGLDVRWGDGQRSLAKALAMKAVLAEYDRAGRKADFLDVSVPDRVLARPILK